ncbi:hypothetical protein [Mycoplasmopsis primatum]|uniref:hypothetical protein n=1 Tax=Mycoplasmopsis primatum TaxID=55604 RepID=UPI000496A70F|nr:hypothetical protein [Mycoplasmopsis primatum]
MIIINFQPQIEQEHKDFSIEELKDTLNNLKSAFDREISEIKTESNNLTLMSFSSENKTVNDFVTNDDWNTINSRLFWAIQTYLDFHKTAKSVLSDLHSFLYKLNPLWDASAAAGDFFGALEESGKTGIQPIDTGILAGKTIFTALGLLKRSEEFLNYSCDFIIHIFNGIMEVSKNKNIEELQNALRIAKDTLNNIDYNWWDYFSVLIARDKVKKSYDTVHGVYQKAYTLYSDYLREDYWGSSSWY